MSRFTSVDRLADLNSQIKDLQDQADQIKTSLKDRGEGDYEGRDFIAAVRFIERVSLDTAAVRSILTPAQIAAVSRTVTSLSLTVRPRKAVATA